MGFQTEEEIDEWLSREKERLDADFLSGIDKDAEDTPKLKAKYDSEMKKLLEKYELEFGKILANATKKRIKK